MIKINNYEYNKVFIDSSSLRMGEKLDNVMHDILPQLKQSGCKISVGYPTKRVLQENGKGYNGQAYSFRMAYQFVWPLYRLGYVQYVGDEDSNDKEDEFLLKVANDSILKREEVLFITQNSELSKQLYEIKNGAKNGKDHLIDIFFISNQSTLEGFVEQKV